MISAEGTQNRAGLAITVVMLAFLHFIIAPAMESWFARPNLLLCAVLITALRLSPGISAGIGFLLGLLEDAMAVSHFGLATISLVVLAYVGSQARAVFLGEEPLFMGTYLFLGTWLYEAVTYLIVGGGGDALSFVLLRAPLDGFATGAVGYLTLPLVRSR